MFKIFEKRPIIHTNSHYNNNYQNGKPIEEHTVHKENITEILEKKQSYPGIHYTTNRVFFSFFSIDF